MRNHIPQDFLKLIEQISTVLAQNCLILFKAEVEKFFAAVAGKIIHLHQQVIFPFP